MFSREYWDRYEAKQSQKVEGRKRQNYRDEACSLGHVEPSRSQKLYAVRQLIASLLAEQRLQRTGLVEAAELTRGETAFSGSLMAIHGTDQHSTLTVASCQQIPMSLRYSSHAWPDRLK